MNRISFIATLLFLQTIVALSQNPISPMGVYIADPLSRVDPDGKMYVYGSVDKTPWTYCSTDYHVLASSDLKEWTLYRNSFASEGKNDAVSYSNGLLYAPDMMYKDGTYYLYYDLSDWTEGVATSSSPTGPFAEGTLIEGPRSIDPNVFVDDVGQAYYFWGQFSAMGAKLNADMKTIDTASIVEGIVTEQEHHFHEGSFVFKRGKYYYYTFADVSRQNRPTCIGYAMSESVFGPYIYKGVIIDNDGCDPNVWNNHGSVVEYRGQWYVMYHRATHNCPSMRKACIEPVTFNDDGTINEVEMTSQGASGALSAFSPIDAAAACLLRGSAFVCAMEDQPQREILTQMHSGDKAAWKYIDFGKGANLLTIRLRTHGKGRVNVQLDQTWHACIGTAQVDTSGEWTTVTCNVEKVTGLHALWITFQSDESNAWMEMDWLRFE